MCFTTVAHGEPKLTDEFVSGRNGAALTRGFRGAGQPRPDRCLCGYGLSLWPLWNSHALQATVRDARPAVINSANPTGTSLAPRNP